jgi:hypothetical protein
VTATVIGEIRCKMVAYPERHALIILLVAGIDRRILHPLNETDTGTRGAGNGLWRKRLWQFGQRHGEAVPR